MRRLRAGSSERPRAGLALLALLGLAAGLRTMGINWDSGALLHPDERFLILLTRGLQWPASLAQYLDSAGSPLNPANLPEPAWYVYGTLPLFAGKLLQDTAPWWGALGVLVPARMLAVAADLGTLIVVFLLGRRISGRATGLLAAALYAVAVLPIQLAHFFTVDPFLNLFLALALLGATRWASRPAAKPALLTGMALGCALASKISALAFTPVLLVALGSALYRSGRRRPWPSFLLLLGTSAVLFRLLQPYAFSGWISPEPRFLDALAQLRMLNTGTVWFPPNFQWYGRNDLGHVLHYLAFWGLGPGLFLAAAGGFVLMLARLRQRIRPAHVLLIVHVAAVLAAALAAFNPTMRYLLPAYPAAAVLAAHFLSALAARPGLRGRLPWPTWLVLGTTWLWALAFTGIYRVPMTRIAASEWIEAHVPAGAVIGVEYWDDGLPVRRPGGPPGAYRQETIRITDPETPEKRAHLIEALQTVDYLVVTSRRAWAALPRLPERFPLASRYYELLFGNLAGFRLVAEFTVYPHLPGLVIPDDTSEEAFTVYDHPRVFVFEKTPDFSTEALRRAFAAVPLPRDPQRLSPDLPTEEAAIPPITDRSLRTPRQAQWLYLGFWIAILAAAGLAGGLLSRGLWPGSQPPGRAIVLGALALLHAAGLRLGLWDAGAGARLFLVLLAAWAVLALWHAPASTARTGAPRTGWVFWVCFGLFLILRHHAPAIAWGERPLDFALLNAFMRAAEYPPTDPWFAGAPLQYHAWGQHFWALVGRMAGVPPSVVYNLAAATVPALAAELLFWLFARMSPEGPHRLSGALLGVVLVLFLGNASFWVNRPWQDGASFMDFWNASRIVPGGIDEFPFWTAVFADLHSHFIGMVFSAMVLASVALYWTEGPRLSVWVLGATALASLALTNGWAIPVYAALWVLLTALHPRRFRPHYTLATLVGAAALTALFWTAPTGRATLGLAVERPVTLDETLVLFGVFFAVIGTWAVEGIWRASGPARWLLLPAALPPLAWPDLRGVAAGLLWLVLCRSWLTYKPRAAWSRLPRRKGPVAASPPPRTEGTEPAEALATVLGGLGLAVLLGSELVTVSDRMNTIFKYQFEAWVLLSVASGLLLGQWLRANARNGWRWGAVSALLATGLPTSAYALWAWWHHPVVPQGRPTLDGLAYLVEQFPDEAPMIAWLGHRTDIPVVLEAAGPPYQRYARVASHTGLPTWIGWPHHVWQHGHDRETIRARQREVAAAYTRLEGALRLEATPIRLAVLCPLERETYGVGAGRYWSQAGWAPVARWGDCALWRLPHSGDRK